MSNNNYTNNSILEFYDYSTLLIKAKEFSDKREYSKCIEYCKRATLISYIDDKVYGLLSYAYYRTNIYKLALSTCKIAFKLNKNSNYALITRGYVYIYQKKYNLALKDFNKSIMLESNCSDAFNGRGFLHIKLNKITEALNDYNNALLYNKNNLYAIKGRAYVYTLLNENKKALKDYNKAIKLDNYNSKLFYNRGIINYNLKKYDDALNDFNKIIDANINDFNALNIRGVTYYEIKEYDKALSDFNQAININSEIAGIYNNRGLVYVGKKEYKDALNDYNTALLIDDNFINAYANRAYLHFFIENYSESLDDYNKIIKLIDDNCEYYYNRGKTYIYLYNYDKAIIDFEKAILINDKHYESYFILSQLYNIKNDYCKSLYLVNKYVKKYNKYAYAYYLRADIYSNMHFYKRALNDYNKAILLAHNAQSFNYRGKYYLKINKYDEAINDFLNALKLDKYFIYSYINLAEYYNIIGDLENTLKYYSIALSINDNLSYVNKDLAKIYYKNKCYNKAIEYYNKAIELYKNEKNYLEIYKINNYIREIYAKTINPSKENYNIQKLLLLFDEKYENSINETKNQINDFIMEKSNILKDFIPELIILKRWNSYTPIISQNKSSLGGGYFFRTPEYGIVIDPGINFIENFQKEGFKFHEIDHIIITHAHNDHTADLESILSILNEYNEYIIGDTENINKNSIIEEVIKEGIIDESCNFKEIEEKAYKKFLISNRKKCIKIYVTASTFKKYNAILNLNTNQNYEVVLIKSNDIIVINNLHNNLKFINYKYNTEITILKASHNDILSDRDSIGIMIHYDKFLLIYTGDTGYNTEIENQYQNIKNDISKKYPNNKVNLLAHIGGFKNYEKNFDVSKSIIENEKYIYKNHLGRIGIAKLVEILKPEICILSEFGEEFKDLRINVTNSFNEIYKGITKFIPADIGLRININNRISKRKKEKNNKKSNNITYYDYNKIDTIENKKSNEIFYLNTNIE